MRDFYVFCEGRRGRRGRAIARGEAKGEEKKDEDDGHVDIALLCIAFIYIGAIVDVEWC